MAFINQAVTVLQTLVIALGAGLAGGASSISWRATATIIRVPRAKGSSSSWLAEAWC